MYGSYHEAKFDAMGLTFRLESHVNTLFEELINDFDLSFITQATLSRIYDYLKLFNRAMNIDGIPAKEFESQMDLLKKSMDIKFVTFTQFLDIFRGFTVIVRNLVSDYFNSIHHQNLLEITGQMDHSKLLPKYASASDTPENMFHKISEIFLRDTIASSLGMQRLDLFLTRIYNTLHDEAEKLPSDKHYMLVTYNPREVVTSITRPYDDLNDIIHLGNKSFNIIKMKGLGLPVPSGFVITTEVFRFRELIENYKPARKNFLDLIFRELSKLEKRTGREFGSPDNALLVSVRSGSAISQPGMLDSYLNVGINEIIVEGIINKKGQEWFAWDCYRRFLQSYGMSFGIARDEFDSIINNFKKKSSVLYKKDLAPDVMKEVSLAYKSYIQSKGIELEESPNEQLYIAVQRVLNSWDSEKARAYRRIMGISDDWGTAVTVQTMVFGNLSQNSGSGVLFTHSPRFSTDKLRPWGDYTIGNQGEDVVSGLVVTHPISKFQAEIENRPEETSLENRFPDIYNALRDIAKILVYDNQWAPQDIEFTFEGPEKKDLRILQTRDMEMREEKNVPSFESALEMSNRFLGHGIGVSGGALSGRTVFDLDDIRMWKDREPETPLVLIRGDTVPDDINEISAADGLLTARGGATSHAAIVANRLDKTCVVGCRDLVCMEKEKKFKLKDKTVKAGDFISINGSEGSIFLGKMKVIDNKLSQR
jgi:pyruvate,orthophosphate dikinase